MAQWRVIREQIQLFPHPGADALQLGKIGPFQVVVQTGLYRDGDTVIFAPEKSLLPATLAEPFRNYLRGPEKNRVGSVRLRGELSMGVIIPLQTTERITGGSLPDCECLAASLGIIKYEPPIPQSLSGEVIALPENAVVTHHDVEQFGIYAGEFGDDEDVVVSEKVHGSQVMFFLDPDGDFGLSSKGVFARGLVIKQSESNLYWKAATNCNILELMQAVKERQTDGGNTIQFFGEALPVQGGNWSYGLDPHQPEVRLFDIRVNGVSVPWKQIRSWNLPRLHELWVPIIGTGRFDGFDFNALCQGCEQVSGQALHIREGVVVRPQVDRTARDGTRLMVKVINPRYAKKETGEEIS